jgi:hypothetical protein
VEEKVASVVDLLLPRECVTVEIHGVELEQAILNHGVLKRRFEEAVRSSLRIDGRVSQSFVVGEVRWGEMGKKIPVDFLGMEVLLSSMRLRREFQAVRMRVMQDCHIL